MKQKKILMVIDAQYDFIENGNLPINGGTKALDNIANHISQHHNEYDAIILTADWHPQTHMSFTENGGEWPKHCIQYTHGASIYQPIINSLAENKIHYHVLTKGCDEDHEEYSIFKNAKSKDYLKAIYANGETTMVDICGLAGDVCVLNTIKDGLVEFPNATFNVIDGCAPSIDGGKMLNDFISKNERVICQG